MSEIVNEKLHTNVSGSFGFASLESWKGRGDPHGVVHERTTMREKLQGQLWILSLKIKFQEIKTYNFQRCFNLTL